MKKWLDFFFPPLCLACNVECKTKFLCPNCWLICELPDPSVRCRHCFKELESKAHVCKQCRENQLLAIPRAFVFDPESPARLLGVERVEAMASFAILQWIQLDWPTPDAIVPMPDEASLSIGRAFAEILDVVFVRALSKFHEYVEDRLDDQQILLVIDVSNSLEDLQKGALELSNSFPKKIYALSLLPYADRIS